MKSKIKRTWKQKLYQLKVKLHKFVVHKTRFPICHGQEGPCFNKGKKQRQNTRYAKEEMNQVFLCDCCMKINHEYWQGRWEEYYDMVM